MVGITCCFEGTLGADATLRRTHTEKTVLTARVAVSTRRDADADTLWVRVTAWDDDALRLAPLLKKGVRVYVEGRLALDHWQGPDGQPRSGLALTAWLVQPLGQIGRRAPRREDGAA